MVGYEGQLSKCLAGVWLFKPKQITKYIRFESELDNSHIIGCPSCISSQQEISFSNYPTFFYSFTVPTYNPNEKGLCRCSRAIQRSLSKVGKFWCVNQHLYRIETINECLIAKS